MSMKSLSLRAALLAAAALLLVAAAPARAELAIAPGTAVVKTHDGDPAGPAVTQAGAHPDLTVGFGLTTKTNPEGNTVPAGSLRNVAVELPPGIVGSAEATPKCHHRNFVEETCDRDAMVGVNTLDFRIGVSGAPQLAPVPVYNLVPQDGAVAQMGFQFLTVSVVMTVRVRSDGSYNLATDMTNASQALQLFGNELTLWGVPADNNGPGAKTFYTGGTYGGPGTGKRVAYLTNPTSCTGEQTATIAVSSWQQPDRVATERVALPGTTGCEQLSFAPTIAVQPTTNLPDKPTGLTVDVGVPQNEDPDGLATPTLRRAAVELPAGLTINAGTAHGLGACAEGEFGLRSVDPAACPVASRVGTVRIDSPAIGEPLTGTVFQGAQASADPASGDMFRLFVEAYGQGVRVKLVGRVIADPTTGRLTTVFDDTPQLPFTNFRLALNGGSRAQLATPRDCGDKQTVAQLTPWSASAATRVTGGFSVACAGSGFVPSVGAGMLQPQAGKHGAFGLRVERPDGHGEIDGLVMKMPRGLLAKVSGVPLCPDHLASVGACEAGSRVGTATIGSGAGASPFFLTGSVSLTGPYKGAPYGLVIAVRALAGPFDLGTVVVRQSIFVDRKDAHMTVISEPIPTIVKGVPLRIRSMNVDVDRQGFMVNPTSCTARPITTTLTAVGDAWHQTPTRFQATGCRTLPFRPKLAMRLAGRNEHTEGKHPGLRATLTQPLGQSNMRRVRVVLPPSLSLDPDNANALCSYEDGQNVRCPESSVIGSATAHSPLLNRPLQAKVYFVQGIRQTKTGPRRTLPTLLIPLRGELDIDIRARSGVSRSLLVTTFDAIPDAAITRFELRLRTGKGGVLVANSDVCRGRHVADVEIDGQSGRQADGAVRVAPPCRRAGQR